MSNIANNCNRVPSTVWVVSDISEFPLGSSWDRLTLTLLIISGLLTLASSKDTYEESEMLAVTLSHRVVSFWQTAVLKEGCARVLEITSRPIHSSIFLLHWPVYNYYCSSSLDLNQGMDLSRKLQDSSHWHTSRVPTKLCAVVSYWLYTAWEVTLLNHYLAFLQFIHSYA